MTQLYSRKCVECGKGMEEGYLSEYLTACSEMCMRKVIGDEAFDEAMKEHEDNGDCEWLFYTDWEQDWSDEDVLYLEDGSEVENPHNKGDV